MTIIQKFFEVVFRHEKPSFNKFGCGVRDVRYMKKTEREQKIQWAQYKKES